MWLKEYYEVVGAAIKKSKEYTDSEVAKVRTKFTVVASYSDLPDPGRTDTIYLVPQTGTPHTYDQYIYEDGQYVDIGDTTIDLDDYVTFDEFQQALLAKVDKVTGKGLSTNDYTTAEKTKLAGIETGAQKNITPDASLDKTSTNAVQNKAVVEGLDELRTDIWEDEVAQGNPIYLELVAEQKAKDAKITFEPTQDFNGYDYPWPAGGGVNKWDEEWEIGDIKVDTGENIPGGNDTIRTKNYIPVVAGQTYRSVVEGAVLTQNLKTRWYDSEKKYISQIPSIVYNSEFVVPSGASFLRFVLQAGYGTTYNHDVAINYPATVTTYSPYSNICPITGNSSISVNGCGKNLFNIEKITNKTGTASITNNHNGSITVATSSTSSGTICNETLKEVADLKAGQKYSLSLKTTASSFNRIYLLQTQTTWNNYESITVTEEMLNSRVMFYASGTSSTATISDIQIEEGETVTDFEPYTSSNDITIQLGDTYYGGTLDVDNGVLSVEYATKKINTLNWSAHPQIDRGFFADLPNSDTVRNSAFCEVLKQAANYNVMLASNYCFYKADNHNLYIKYPVDDVNLMLNDVGDYYLCHALATPTTIQLTPFEINLLKGANTIWTDGKDLTITYNYGQIATKKDLEDYVPWTMVDQEMDPTSQNPVSNEAVSEALSSLNTSINEALTELDGEKVDKNELYGDNSVSGNPVTLKSTVSQLAKSTKITFEPVQDLHGYEYPWAGGAGKNKFDSSLFNTYAASVIYRSYEVENGTYTMSTPDFPVGDNGGTNAFFIAGQVSSGAASDTNGVFNGQSRTITVTDGYFTVAYRSISSVNNNNPKDFKWQIESGSTATDWTPYTNICPIDGWTELSIQGRSKNLCKLQAQSKTEAGVTWTVNSNEGTITVSGSATGFSSIYIANFRVPKDVIILSGISDATNIAWNSAGLYNRNGNLVANLIDSNYLMDEHTVDLRNYPTGYSLKLSFKRANQGAVSGTIRPMARLASVSDNTFEPYAQSNDIAIPLGQIMYGGELDVENGECRVTHGIITFDGSDDEQWSFYTTSSKRAKIELPNYITPRPSEVADIKCNKLKTVSRTSMSDNNYYVISAGDQGRNYMIINVNESTIPNVRNWLSTNNIVVSYNFTIPTVITLTPAQITLLKGMNTLWTDGSEIDVTFDVLSDDNGRIVSILGNFAPIEGPKASAAYAVGDYLILNDKFCKVTDAIAIGDAIVVGTNVSQTTIAAELALIFSQLN